VIATAITIRLTWSEAELAAYAGIKRRLIALCDARPDRHGYKQPDPWGEDIEAAGAELAVARATGLYWTAWARKPAHVVADVGDNIQVRRRAIPGGDLIVHPSDRDDHRFVLVYGKLPTFTIVGWLDGATAKADYEFGDPHGTGRPAHWVPPDETRPFNELLARLVAV